VLRLKRKQRESKACYPCRQRKVKCDGSHPCRTCVKRDHPEICAYNVEKGTPQRRTRSRQAEQTAKSRNEDARPTHSPASADADSQLLPTSPLSSPRSSAQANEASSYVFSGDNSLVSMLRQQDPDGAMAREATSVLGLHNTYLSYPFIESKTPQDRWVALVDILPHRDEVLKYAVPLGRRPWLTGQVLPFLPYLRLSLQPHSRRRRQVRVGHVRLPRCICIG
jgi:hypothetical protein